jgi:hypothetical protein
VRREIEYQARGPAPHASLFLYSGNNESPDFANLPLFVATQLGTMQKENTNAALLPSCPSDGWATLEPLTPRNGKKPVVLSHFYIETIILPRQARDKHRESTQKRHYRLSCRLPVDAWAVRDA